MSEELKRPQPNAANHILDALGARRLVLENARAELKLKMERVDGGIYALDEVIDLVRGKRVHGLPEPEKL